MGSELGSLLLETQAKGLPSGIWAGAPSFKRLSDGQSTASLLDPFPRLSAAGAG